MRLGGALRPMQVLRTCMRGCTMHGAAVGHGAEHPLRHHPRRSRPLCSVGLSIRMKDIRPSIDRY